MNKQTLIDLRDEVVAGEWFPGLAQRSFGGVQKYHHAHDAYNGSLDAAKALHEAVLPGWNWLVGTNTVLVSMPDGERMPDGRTGLVAGSSKSGIDPARAWLIAILKALIALE